MEENNDENEPEIDENEVKIRVKACGINRLDIFTRAGKRGVKVNFDGPHILGGDVAGVVVETGELVSSVKIGQRVVVNPRLVCSECKDCLLGNDESCTRYRMLGTSINGGYAEYTKTHKDNVFEIPDSLSYEGAAALSFAKQQQHGNAIHGHDTEQEDHPLTKTWIASLQNKARKKALSFEWICCYCYRTGTYHETEYRIEFSAQYFTVFHV